MAVDRFRLAAIADRLIYGSDDTFDRDDALTLYEMIRLSFGGGVGFRIGYSFRPRAASRAEPPWE